MATSTAPAISKRRRILSLPPLPVAVFRSKSQPSTESPSQSLSLEDSEDPEQGVPALIVSEPESESTPPTPLSPLSPSAEAPSNSKENAKAPFWGMKKFGSSTTNVSTPLVQGVNARAGLKLKRSPQSQSNSAAASALAIYSFISGTSPDPGKNKADLNKVKSQLTKPDKARRIVGELKRIQKPPTKEADGRKKGVGVGVAGKERDEEEDALLKNAKKICLECGEEDVVKLSSKKLDGDAKDSQPHVHPPQRANSAPPPDTGFQNLLALPGFIPSPGDIVGQAGTSSGAYSVMADVSATLVNATGREVGDVPVDRMSVFIYWWGYELFLPPPTIRYLSTVHSVSGTFFTFLSTFATAGGAAELTPFIRYLSMWADMEWKAITSQDKGNGVILAATWVLPVAIVPRAWDV
ncbi:hypothetical protein BT69DRAFT_1300666 [Atractiella rhizophila]|nr:hypothetical protein BT69DRAFT_1300666 [Atractiella rhizophila]